MNCWEVNQVGSFIIAVMNLFGMVFFLLAALWGVFNYRENVSVSQFWVIYAIAALGGAAFLGLRALEWGGVAPQLMDELQPFFGIVGITMIATTATICALSPVKHNVK